jgi:hypothetical protein
MSSSSKPSTSAVRPLEMVGEDLVEEVEIALAFDQDGREAT